MQQTQNVEHENPLMFLPSTSAFKLSKKKGCFIFFLLTKRFSVAALASHDYILKIVPTVYEDLSGRQRFSYQYTVANKVLYLCFCFQ